VAKHKTVFAENMVSNLAQFSIIFDPYAKDWAFSKLNRSVMLLYGYVNSFDNL